MMNIRQQYYSTLLIIISFNLNPWIKIIRGYDSSFCILPSRPLTKTICWFDGTERNLIQPQLLNISLGCTFLCSLDLNQTLECYGDNSSGESDISNIINLKYVLLKSGQHHTCASDYELIQCWGDNSFGQTDFNNNIQHKVVSIEAGPFTSCAFYSNFSLTCIGEDQQNVQFNTHLFKHKFSLEQILSYGSGHTSCLLQKGNSNILLDCFGDCLSTMCNIPEDIKQSATSVSTGHDHVCGTKLNQAGISIPECWGSDEYGQSSIPYSISYQTTDISAGQYNSCGLNPSGFLICWGRHHQIPKNLITFVSMVSVGFDHTCVIRNGFTKCFGNNENDQCDVSMIGTITPDTLDIKLGNQFTCKINLDERMRCQGSNMFGVLDEPEILKTKYKILVMSAGLNHVCIILQKNDQPICWGKNDNNQNNILQWKAKLISAGGNHTCLQQQEIDGFNVMNEIFCFGLNDQGQLDINNSIDFSRYNIEAISSGQDHNCAKVVKRENYTRCIVCWGSDQQGQSQLPMDPAVIQVSAGNQHSCQLSRFANETKVHCQGYNASIFQKYALDGQKLNVNSSLNHDCVVQSDGMFECIGNKEQKQLSIRDDT